MSELYTIVLQGKEELGNDPEAIRLWAELSGVDIDSINENTPFDIDVADRLLRTLPEVINRMKRRTTEEIETLEEKLKKVLESREKDETQEHRDLLEKLDEELESASIFPIEEDEGETPELTKSAEAEAEAVEPSIPEDASLDLPLEIVIKESDIPVADLVSLFKLSKNSVEVLKGKWPPDYADVLLHLLRYGGVNRFHLTLKSGYKVWGEYEHNELLVGEFEVENVGVAKLLFEKVKRLLR
ncbi:MAG: hypothetical protein GXO39_09865 [Thermotogae bacterium]|nr:hypothetical protein [Thermotogota bacterium]